jgi:hypothetical protein
MTAMAVYSQDLRSAIRVGDRMPLPSSVSTCGHAGPAGTCWQSARGGCKRCLTIVPHGPNRSARHNRRRPSQRKLLLLKQLWSVYLRVTSLLTGEMLGGTIIHGPKRISHTGYGAGVSQI